jgi:hypothetical protein
MSKRHTLSRSFVEKPKVVHILFRDNGDLWTPMTWHTVGLADVDVLVEVLRAEGKEFAIMK